MTNKDLVSMFNIVNDMAELNLGTGDELDKLIESVCDLGKAMGKEELIDEKVAMIPAEGLEKPNARVVMQQQQAWERFQQRVNEQELGKTRSR